MKVSVVIPTTDKELHLAERCKQSVIESNIDAEDVEVIIVNEGLERSAQRNIGIDRATGEYILYLDSDQMVTPNLLDECLTLAAFGFNALYIPEIITTPGWFGRLRNFERQFYTGTPVDCIRFFKKDDIRFDTSLKGPEDADFDLRIPGPKWITESPLLHRDDITLWGYIKKKAYYAKSMNEFAKRHPKAQVLNLKYRCWTVFIEDGKWRKLLRHPLKTAGLFFLITIRGVIYVTKNINLHPGV